MASLWFRADLIADILSGVKRSTIRRRTELKPGDIVSVSVGPRPPVGHVVIEHVEDVQLSDLDPDYQARIVAIYGGEHQRFKRIRFALIDSCRLPLPAPPAEPAAD